MSLIEIRNLRKEYSPDVVPLKGVNADIEAGEVISIIGPSGTGKSTLLRCINRLETPTSGQIIVDGVDVCAPGTDLARLRKSMGMVFQSFNLFPHKMAVENIMLPQQSLLGKSAREAYEEAMKQLERVGLADRARQYPDELSGGQKQRVAIARALAMHPQILLFDEPTSALDPTMVSEVLSVIRDLAGTGLTMLLVTHEMRLARHVSDRVFFMTDGEIYEEGSPEQIFEHPLREGTRNFIFRIRSWTCILSPSSRDFHGMTGSLEKFCKDQFLGRRQAMNCQLAVEELVVSFLLPAVESAGQGAFHMTLFAGEEGAERKLMIDCSGFPEGKKIFDELLKNIPAVASTAAGSVKFPGSGAGSMEAASAAILENVLRRLPDEGEDTVVFRIL
ncbi:MAG: amino acid ABC transporter ATP-binding protein [Lachnospiraceae bacterium]|nr:amino acid ABC transporter ATP-binding protein [Lachnospiraceae bacterium]